MGKFIKFLAATTALCSCSFAQDILIGCNGKMKKGFVVNIQADKIIYKTNRSEAALYSVRRDEVLTVIFENGNQQVFECQQVQTPPQTGAIVTVEANISANGSPNAVAKIADAAAVAAVNQASDIAKAGINNAAQNITGNIAGGKL
ncbi:MAG: hypothetical protein FWF51_11105, partial [Chitinivibrionia bacterium]|nr:hypothetical protein [Chitinivibrionia bacterium]